MKKLEHRYSGKKSENFWNRVNSLKKKSDQSALYALGCALQNLEYYVLTQLENAKKGSVKNN